MRSIAVCAALGAGLVAAPAARAQSFPAKPIRIIAPYTAGGAADLLSRFLCEKFPAAMGEPCVVENKPGAGGIIGFDLAAKSEPDGHTLVMAPNNLAIIPVLPSLYPNVPYDTLKDLAPIALVASTPIMVGAHPAFPAQSFPELIAYARANSGKVNFTTCGPASPQHLAGEMLASRAGFTWIHVPYKGCGDALTAVVGGTVPVFISTVAHFNPQIKSGKLRGFAVLGPTRSQFAPDYPTVAESGFPGYEVNLWFGLLAQGRTPAPVIARLNAEVNKALESPDLREKLRAQSYEPLGGPPERFAEAIRADMERFGKVIRDGGVKME
ncbi:MAG TPA: tripartite tricarboxylate transporter substrate binding protein [Burkholderiales bacterium]|nr:tripartite tricarboxylate transporter substrate binding protein [Burkholderiales bacterium]